MTYQELKAAAKQAIKNRKNTDLPYTIQWLVMTLEDLDSDYEFDRDTLEKLARHLY